MPIKWEKGKGKGEGRWRFEFDRVIKGERFRASLILPKGWSRSQADAYDQKETARIYAEASGIKQPERLIQEAIEVYLSNKTHLKNYKKMMQDIAHVIPYYEGRPLEELPNMSEEYTKANPELAPATIHNRLAYIKAAVNFYCKKEKIPSPANLMEMPAVNNERHIYKDRKDVLILMRACKDLETRAIMKIAFYTGLRWRSEILTLTKKSIKRDLFYIGDTKNGEQHTVPVHPRLNVYLKRIPFKKHDRMYYEHFEKARAKVEMPEATMHTLRHSFASEMMIEHGADLRQVAMLLNHKSLQASKRYTHLSVEGKRKLIAKFGMKK
jgi:integrase